MYVKLQWSHADEGVEDMRMTKRSFVRRAMLQWSHADEGVEDGRRTGFADRPVAGFNGATPMKAWKTNSAHRGKIQHPRLQWSHADEGVEDTATAALCP